MSVEREAIAQNRADLLLLGASGEKAIIEIKVGHVFDAAQQQRYEQLEGANALYLAALNMDEQRLTNAMTDRWRFLSLTELFEAWLQTEDDVARVFAEQVSSVFRMWDANMRAVFQACENTEVRPLSSIREKSLARVVSRRIAIDLRERGRLAYAGIARGGGVPVVQARTPIHEKLEGQCFIAEVRWRQDHPLGELRFGIDFVPRPGHMEDEKLRRTAHNLAVSMEEELEFDALHDYLQDVEPHLASSLARRRRTRPEARGDWEKVIQQGLENIPRENGKKLSRRHVRPVFYGDGTLRFQAMTNLDFTKIDAREVIELLDLTLVYLMGGRPRTRT